KIVIAGQNFAGYPQPVFGENRLQAGHRWPGHAAHRIAPSRVAGGALVPVVVYSGASDETDLPIDDHQLAMRAVIDLRYQIDPERVIPLDASAGFDEFPEPALANTEAADEIDDQLDLHARPRPLRESIAKFRADLALVEDVGLQIDRFPRVRDRVQFGLIETG